MKKGLTILMILFSTYSFGQSQEDYINLDKRENIFNKTNLLPYIYGKEVKEGWTVNIDSKNNLVFTVVIDSLKAKKDELFNQALSYFTYNYVNAKNVIQTQDKEAGLIIAKGTFSERAVSREEFGMGVYSTTEYKANHIIRIDIKDTKVRIIVSVSSIEQNATIYSSLSSDLPKHVNQSRNINVIAPIKNYNDTTGLYLQYSSLNGEKISQRKYDKWVKKGRESYQKWHDMDIRIFDGICLDVLSTISSFEESLTKGNTSTENNNW